MSLLPITSKILERAVVIQIMEFIIVNDLLHPSHDGGWAHHITTTAIIEMYDQIYNFKESAINWMTNYLSEISQCVSIKGDRSDILKTDVRFPQGSVLGGLLYVLLVGELANIIHDHENQENNEDDKKVQHINCETCCFLTTFIYDSTYAIASLAPQEISTKLMNLWPEWPTIWGTLGYS